MCLERGHIDGEERSQFRSCREQGAVEPFAQAILWQPLKMLLDPLNCLGFHNKTAIPLILRPAGYARQARLFTIVGPVPTKGFDPLYGSEFG